MADLIMSRDGHLAVYRDNQLATLAGTPGHVATWPRVHHNRILWIAPLSQQADAVPIGYLFVATLENNTITDPYLVRWEPVGHPEWVDHNTILVWRQGKAGFEFRFINANNGNLIGSKLDVPQDAIDPTPTPDGDCLYSTKTEIVWKSEISAYYGAPDNMHWFDPYMSPTGEWIGLLEQNPNNPAATSNVVVNAATGDIVSRTPNTWARPVKVWWFTIHIDTPVTTRVPQWDTATTYVCDRQQHPGKSEVVRRDLTGREELVIADPAANLYYPAVIG